MEISNEYKKNIYWVLLVFLIILSLYFAIKFLSEFKSYDMIGSTEVSVITLSGHGEIQAVPDIASVYFTINKEAKTVKEAQTFVAEIEKKALDFLKENNILEKDIKTLNASFNPKYEYKYASQLCNEFGCPPNGKSVIVGYESSESITVKVRNTDDVGKIIQGLGTLGVSDLNGPNFSIDNEDGLKAEARKKAIDDAKAKAKALANDLGVHLGKIISFNESGDYPVPMYDKVMMGESVTKDSSVPSIPKGENTISSDVTITYEIR
ncbi:hypothetical protein CO033_02485 [Candidatus Nomurabacteria bacterium CG_4_9_14_0_2_um_filter_32_10]|uniref:SIMPL domain-containing protein n=3 Tax=Candidatus Nomuraibacteriota TaxID=1752729 RepID=A0A2H0CIQ0_9BACT|nr:MAG: hypothetical protein COW91_00360 [Candidatus Nomurabacteria bacterium CG22_combo_CG10-13_8_21_14_all_32_8]PJC49264.1 MAG: hypothetical protein CO033_02485 [Candidatus Nomurabacteria bacterium CG_4_9_14_0_2_um_filter_32_10]